MPHFSLLPKVPYVRSVLLREFMAEFLGILILCVIGNGSIAQQVLSRRNDFLSINLAYGVAVTFGVYVAFGVSGGHINPAVTLSQAVIGKFPWHKVPVFFAAHYLGGFVSAIIVWGIYHDGIQNLDGGVRQVTGVNATAGIFATYPLPFVTNVTAFFDQVLGTSILLIGILALTNEKNVSLRVKSLEPLVIGFLITAIGLSYGINCGYAINPARDLAPRIFTSMIGYGRTVFSEHHYYFWIPVIGPHCGAIVGTLLYKYLVGMHFAHDMELLASVSGSGGADDTAARVGKGEADGNEFGKKSPPPSENGTGARRSHNHQHSSSYIPHEIVIGNQNTMLGQNTYGRQLTVAPPGNRRVMWRQSSLRSGQNGVGDVAVEMVDVPETIPISPMTRNRVKFTPLTSKRPGI